MKKNYIDEKGNYQNVENLTLRQIYDRGIEEGIRSVQAEKAASTELSEIIDGMRNKIEKGGWG